MSVSTRRGRTEVNVLQYTSVADKVIQEKRYYAAQEIFAARIY
jgi:hypothetical protein